MGQGQMTESRTDERATVSQDALSVLRDVLEWRLSDVRWEGIAGSVEALTAGLSTGDLAAAREAVIQLELAGPVRITRIGARPTEPAPPRVRERINQLVFQLSGGKTPVPVPGQDEGAEGDGQPGGAS